MRNWEEIKAWRKATRKQLLEQRTQIGAEHFFHCCAKIERYLKEILAHFQGKTLGFYWPFFKGEFDALPLVGEFLGKGGKTALPVFGKPFTPMRFCDWAPGHELVPGRFRIPMPKETNVVMPDVVFVPFLAFDSQCHRLGFGLAYYDATLAALTPRPYAVGIGYEFQRLETIFPQPFDVPMDVIVTETGAHTSTDA
ncbi:MAG: 5-formyltetrahydrofolate cyclo-ligase [Acidiferrobacterales bacterium]